MDEITNNGQLSPPEKPRSDFDKQFNQTALNKKTGNTTILPTAD